MALSEKLKKLTSLGKKRGEIRAFDMVFEIEVLNTNDSIKAMDWTARYDNITRITAMKVETLARAIRSIDGELASTGEEGINQMRLELSEMQLPVINLLMSEYDKLVQLQNAEIETSSGLKKDKRESK